MHCRNGMLDRIVDGKYGPPLKGCGFPVVLVVKIGHSFPHFGLKLGVVLPLSGGQF